MVATHTRRLHPATKRPHPPLREIAPAERDAARRLGGTSLRTLREVLNGRAHPALSREAFAAWQALDDLGLLDTVALAPTEIIEALIYLRRTLSPVVRRHLAARDGLPEALR
jgi:hypothetical protein